MAVLLWAALLAYHPLAPVLAPAQRACASPVMQQRGGRMQAKPGDWICQECGAGPCFASRSDCYRCGAPRPANAFDAFNDDGDGGGRSSFGRSRPSERDRGPPRSLNNGRWGAAPADRRPQRAAQTYRDVEEDDFQNTRVFVENLADNIDWRVLKDAFVAENYPVAYASVSTDRTTGASKGHGIIQFETAHAAQHAIEHMTGYELNGLDINVRPDYQERDRRGADRRERGGRYDGGGGGGGVAAAPPKQPWLDKAWTRVKGSDDATVGADLDEREVELLLSERDEAREQRDYATADGLLDELTAMGVALDDARRQRVWWLGRRADGQVARDGRGGRGGGRGAGRGGGAGRGRRDWYREGGPKERGY